MKRTYWEGAIDARGFFGICGDFGEVDGDVELGADRVVAKNEVYTAALEWKIDENGVLEQKGRFLNHSDHTIEINSLASRFVFSGGDWEVYTQYHYWQNESQGAWQPLHTSVTASVQSTRSCSGAAPMLAIWNKQTDRGYVFHLITHATWEMNAIRAVCGGENNCVVVELGINRRGFSKALNSGESVSLPEVICYSAARKIDLDCYKLHTYLHRRFPRRSMPIVYNSWLYRFDKIDTPSVLCQIEKAAALGAEYFVVDAGWFGNGPTWWGYRGDWYENQTSGFCGHMKEVSDQVRAHGMKFGFWLEIESAGGCSNIIQKHPEYFIRDNAGGNYFLNFANPTAASYIADTVIDLVHRYNVEFIKFDFNQDLFFDSDRNAFSDYHKGHRWVLKKIKDSCPNIYLENCASGGLRMELSDVDLFDSCWISDNHSPYVGMRIFRDTLLRMAPQFLEKWAAIRSVENFEPIYNTSNDKLLSAHECCWGFAVELTPSFLRGFMLGGPFGISADLNLLSETSFAQIRETIRQIKEERPFWQSAVCRILANSDSVFALEYYDEQMKTLKILTYSLKAQQSDVLLYPFADGTASYQCNDRILTGKELSEDGIQIKIPKNYECTISEWHRV